MKIYVPFSYFYILILPVDEKEPSEEEPSTDEETRLKEERKRYSCIIYDLLGCAH